MSERGILRKKSRIHYGFRWVIHWLKIREQWGANIHWFFKIEKF